jgi:hypothetical protein
VPGTVVRNVVATGLYAAWRARRGRRGGTERDSLDVVDAAARDRWVPGPEVAQVPVGLFPVMTE